MSRWNECVGRVGILHHIIRFLARRHSCPFSYRPSFTKVRKPTPCCLVFSGAGSICGALIVAAMEKFKGQTRLTVLILAFLGFVIAGFALSTWLPLSCLLIFLRA